ncbi:MAG: Coenzyme F420 hydrogenase/dehydrogenase, beta subunit C-terminal domain [Hydrogenophaga sp.]|nr:Coenzyme F420 hydrogenase/dehydrogenase, beta subunit C-terminal domain [Hydrogenophaga sp.]
MKKNKLQNVINNNLCAGCGLCQSVFGDKKILIKIDRNGFYRPCIKDNLTEIESDLLSGFCPGIIVKKPPTKTPAYDSIWGEMYDCFIGAASDTNVRNEASSGGAISSILMYLLEGNFVDAIIHTGASGNQAYINEVKISTNSQQIIDNANSRYSPSAPLIDILNNIQKFKKVAFVGKPCDVAALRQYAEFNSEVKEKVKFYISFFCAGVPSINATFDIVRALDVDLDNVKKLDYRKEGWPGFFRIIDINNNKHKLSYSLTWMKLLGPKVQFRCKLCSDGVGHLADIVCADAWEEFDEKGFPTFKNAPGKSLIISRTKVGKEILEQALSNKYLISLDKIINYRTLDKMQPGQLSKKQFYLSRKLATLLKTGSTVQTNYSFYLKATLTKNLFSHLKNFLGTIRRI